MFSFVCAEDDAEFREIQTECGYPACRRWCRIRAG